MYSIPRFCGFMWDEIQNVFVNTPSRLKVAKLCLEHGFRLTTKGIFAGEVELSPTKIAKAVGVDRKVVEMTMKVILENVILYQIFSKLKPVADISDVARYFDKKKRGVMLVHAYSSEVGTAALVTDLLAKEDIMIRYMLCKDPELSVEATMVIVTEQSIPGQIVDQLLKSEKIISVTLS